jgi:hypothetical protein
LILSEAQIRRRTQLPFMPLSRQHHLPETMKTYRATIPTYSPRSPPVKSLKQVNRPVQTIQLLGIL